MNRLITLTTDFGLSDGFVGMMKGVILNINPDATIVDITHDIAPQNIEEGAFLFANASRFFPAHAIHVVVVDPGVGTARRPIALQTGETFFVAPDNGVLSRTLRADHASSAIRAVHLNRAEYWLAHISNTFHGRDIFAPVAAHLSRGVSLDALGDPIDDWARIEIALPTRDANGALIGKVIHIDRFGNAITNIAAEMLAGLDRAEIEIAGRVMRGIRATYADGAPGEPIALISSSGHLEIARREANAAKSLQIEIGNQIRVSP
ncbi:MAG: SAM-dependent chlorinase/fluorinase [Chloroflexi bacterium]|nr:SAM-dependent chlorinase/fluorinase [Chloroflexota bacterium]